MRKFSTGATRDNDEQKINIIGSFSPLVICRFAQFMRNHNIKGGELKRDEANWKKGMPKQSYFESKARHFLDTWKTHEGYEIGDIEEMLCADLFNTQGHLHELLVTKLKHKKAEKRKIKKKSVKPIRIKFYTKKIIHYWPKNKEKTICGLKIANGTEDRKKVTCKTCLKSIKLWQLSGMTQV